MIDIKTNLHHFSVNINRQTQSFWHDVRQSASSAGQWLIDVAKTDVFTAVGRNMGAWSLPWKLKILDRFKMPAYDPTFKKNWTQITNERAADVKKLIQEKNKKFCVLYSGGIDSLLITTSLLINLSNKELENISFYCNTASIIENPKFYKKYIHEKFVTIDSTKYLTEDVVDMGYIIISSMSGDSLCGSKGWLDLHNNFFYYIKDISPTSKQNIIKHWPRAHDPEVHYTIFKDMFISKWGETYWHKVQKNILTSDVPVNSLYDMVWWTLFNLRYVNIAMRTYTHDNFKHCFDYIDANMFDWYNTQDYQKWSMVNNNNGEKINLDVNLAQASLKWCAKKYIYEFDKNDWYLFYKQKLASGEMQKLRQKDHLVHGEKNPMTFFALTDTLQPLYLFDDGIKEYVAEHFSKFEKDW